MRILNSLRNIFSRSITSDKLTPNKAFEIGLDWAPQASSGEQVSPQTALGITAYLAAIRAISEDVAKLPLKVFRDNGDSKEQLNNHPLQSLLDWPNNEMTAMSFRETLTSHALGWGGGYAEIQRDGAGRAVALWILPPQDVSIKRTDSGELFYQIRLSGGRAIRLNPQDVLHIRGLGLDGITSYVLASIAREPLGVALALNKFTGSYFGNSANPSGYLSHPGHLSEAALKNLRESLQRRYSGSANAGKTMILEEGMEYNASSHTPEQAQLTQLKQFTIDEVARLFRIPPHKIGSLLRATFSNIEHQSLEYVTDTLQPWATRWEQEIERKLTGARVVDVYVRHNFSALLRGDAASRAQYYQLMMQNGLMSRNEIRKLEELPPVVDGDVCFVPVNLQPADRAINPPPPPPAPASPPAPAPQEPADKAEEKMPMQEPKVTEAQRMAFKSLLVDSISRSLRVELARLEGGKTAADATQFRNIISAPIRAIAATYGVEAVSITQSAVEYHVEQSNNQKATELDADAWTARAYAEAERILESMKEQK